MRALHLRGHTLTLRGMMGVTDPASQARATRYTHVSDPEKNPVMAFSDQFFLFVIRTQLDVSFRLH